MVQNLTYTQYGDYYIPDLRLAHTGTQTPGKYGRMRRVFLEQNKPMIFNDMVLTETSARGNQGTPYSLTVVALSIYEM